MADQLGNSGLEKQHGSEFPGFTFCLLHPMFELEQATNLEISMSTDNKNPPRKACSLYPKDQERGSLARQ